MPHLLDTPTRAQTICAAVSRLIASGGLAALTTRAIAAESGVSIATLAHQFTNRERLLRLMATMFGADLVGRTASRSRSEGVLAFLPADVDDLRDLRVWLAWAELGRSDPGIAGQVAHLHSQERLLLDAVLERRFDPVPLDCAAAMIDGLRAAVCAVEDPMSVERARAALQLGLGRLGGGA